MRKGIKEFAFNLIHTVFLFRYFEGHKDQMDCNIMVWRHYIVLYLMHLHFQNVNKNTV